MRWKEIVGFLCLFFVISASTPGCRQIRLLQVKRQLASFDTFFQVKEEHGPALVFLRPVLLQDDILWLTQQTPTTNELTDEGILWTYVFEKQYSVGHRESRDFTIQVGMLFQHCKLHQVRYPRRFHTVLTKEFLVGILRSLAHADINITKRSLTAKWNGRGAWEPVTIPDRSDVMKVLGKPFCIENSKRTSTITYKYQLKGASCREKEAKSNLWTIFVFRQPDQQLMQTRAQFNGREISVYFSTVESQRRHTRGMVSASHAHQYWHGTPQRQSWMGGFTVTPPFGQRELSLQAICSSTKTHAARREHAPQNQNSQ